MNKWVIIVAGGSGARFGSAVPKQFLELGGEPVLMRSIRAFYSALEGDCKIVVALPENQIDYWHSLCRKHKFDIDHRVVAGGDSRYASVKNALGATGSGADELIAVHDGVRPLVSRQVITDAFVVARMHTAAVPAIAVTDTIRQLDADGSRSTTLNRNLLRAVQTPQVFRADMLHEAYRQPYSDTFTDDASVWESAGNQIALSAGDPLNIKITHPTDIAIAELILSQR